MPYLNWISDENLTECVTHLLTKASMAKANTNFGKNVIDPFASMFEIAGFQMDYDMWVKSEASRQAQKTLQNHIGDFHQKILGHSNGWCNMMTGGVVDLVCESKRIIAEVKNKHNTLSGGKLADLYNSFSGLIMPKASIYKGYTAYYVTVIPSKPKRYDLEFTPSNKEQGEKCAANPKIREIDGASFYALATGQENALEQLFEILPTVIFEASNKTMNVTDKEKLAAFFKLAYG